MDANFRMLILRARDGDIDAFSTIVERRWVGLVRFARSVAGEADAEDVVQEGLITAWKKLPDLRAPEAFSSWLLRIVSRACFRRTRRRRNIVPLASIADKPDPRNPERLEAIEVEQILATLPPRQRAVMHLTVIEGMTDTQIGEALGISAGGVRAHRRRAREALSPLLPAGASDQEEKHEAVKRHAW